MTTLFWSNLIWIIPLVCAAVCLILGDLISIVTKALPGVAGKLASGFVGALAVFHIESLPFMFLDLSFSLLCIIYGCTLGALIVVYVILNITGKRIPFKEDIDCIVENEKYIKSHDWWKFIVWALALVLIFLQIRNVILYVQFNVDDNFYVAESVTALSRDRIMSVLPASGIEGSKFPVMYLLVSFEAFISFIAKTFSIAPAALCHSVLPAFFIPLHYVCLALVGKELGKGKCGIFALFAAILNWVSGPFTYSQGAFLILRIWQGKAVLVNIIFPLVLYVFIRILKEKKLSLKYGIYLCALLLTGQAASTVGTYLVPLLYAVYAVAFLIIVRKWKEFFKLFIPAAFITPFVVWKLYILISTATLGSISEGTGVKAKTFMEIFTRFFGWSTLPLIFVLALVVLLLKLKKDEDEAYCLRFFFLISSALLIILFINPVVMPFVESFITGVGVYWRVLWLLQITVVVAAGMTELSDRWSVSFVKALLVVFCCVVLFVSGRSIFKDEDVKISANPYKISETTKAMADVIEETSDEPLKDVTIILPRVLSSELRQYKDICQVYYPYVSNNYMEYQTKAEYKKMMALYNELYNYQSFKVADLTETTKLLDLDYVAMYSEAAARQEKAIPGNFEKCYDDGLYCLYKVK